jgi:hypothetical protein
MAKPSILFPRQSAGTATWGWFAQKPQITAKGLA